MYRVLLLWILSLGTGVQAVEPKTNADPYLKALQPLKAFISQEVKQKKLPALSIALVDDQRILWQQGFGYQNQKAKTPATAETVYRVGSVSKLFTDIAVMQLVEKGELDLDAPITKYLPDFKPKNPWPKEQITLRQMMAHHSGLIREPPVGNYFDPTNPTLKAMVESLYPTRLVYKPRTKQKYSNAAIATVGYVLEKTQKTPFPKYLQQKVLQPLGMTHSAFEPTAKVKKHLAQAVMWTYHGREFPAPTFELGMAPAGSMYSTVTDLSRFLSALFNEGKGIHGQILKKETLEMMWTPQFADKDAEEGFGIGFHISKHQGKRKIGHGGAIYGFATQLSALPEEKLGVIVVTSRDVANSAMRRIADLSLDTLLAVREKKPMPKMPQTQPIDIETARKLRGRYKSEKQFLDVMERDGRVRILPARGSLLVEIRATEDGFQTEDVHHIGLKIKQEGKDLKLGSTLYKRLPDTQPASCPTRWLGLIGEYGWDHNVLYILEKDGELHALIEWIFLYPLTEVSENVYEFPDYGLYHGEKLIFQRDKSGRSTQVEAANVVFRRRRVDGEGGVTFRIKPRRAISQIRKEALKASPPPPAGEIRKSDLIDLATLDKTIKFDIRYATTNNFLSTKFYTQPRAFLQRPAAQALLRVHKKLKEQGYGLLIHDAYRPWHVTKMFWDATPDSSRLFVANPLNGSRHNRGCAVDLTLYDLKSGTPIEMVSGYDEFSDRSFPDYLGGTSRQRWHRDLLRQAMESEEFQVYEAEWWHFDYREWKKYPILNLTFEQLKK